MVGKINMKQLRRQEERSRKKAANREMEQEQCIEYFEESQGGSTVNAKGTNRKGQVKEHQKRERKEEVKLPAISWHGELEIDSITFPLDLETAYETLGIELSTSDEVVVESLMNRLDNLSRDVSLGALDMTAREHGCILLVLCDRATLFDSHYFTLIQFIYAYQANKYLDRLRLPLPRIPEFSAPMLIPNFPKLSDVDGSIKAKLMRILLFYQYPPRSEPPFELDGDSIGKEGKVQDYEGMDAKVAELVKIYGRMQNEKDEIRDERDKLKAEIEELKKMNEALLSEKEIANAKTTLAQLDQRSKALPKASSDSSKLKETLAEAREEIAVKDVEIKLLKEREARTNTESKKMRERSRRQLGEKDEVIRELRESNAKLTEDLSTATAQTTSDEKLKSELAEAKIQLREAQAKSTSFSEFKECINLQSKVSKELAIEVARLKGSASFSTSSPSSSDKKDFVITTLSKKVIDLSKQVKEQNEQLAEMMIVMSKSDDD